MKDDITSKPIKTSDFFGRFPFWEQHNKIIFYELAGVLLIIYAGGIYFQAATASIGESFQPGIYTLKKFVTPGLWIILLLLTALFKQSAYLARLGMVISAGAVLVCIVMSGFVYTDASDGHSIIGDVPRTVPATIHKALFYPNFSNRSYAPMFYGSIFACFYYWAGYTIYKRNLRRP